MPYKKFIFFFKKKLQSYLYIFFLILNFNFVEFSTNKTIAKTFVVSKIEVEENYNLNFNKLKVIDRAFKIAFNDLSRMVLEEKDFYKISDTPIENIKNLVDNFSILDEKFISRKYKNIMEVQFNQKKLIKFFNAKNITLSLPKKLDVFFLPLIVDLEKNSLVYLNNNIFLTHWEMIEKNYFLIDYIIPNEDMEDYINIKKNLKNIQNYDFNEILKKYDTENHIIMIIFKRKDNIKFYSRINIEENYLLLNNNFKNKNFEDQSDLNFMILSIKNKYEDKWKSINKMNPLTSVPIRLSLKSNQIDKSLKLENALNILDFVNDYKIDKFNSLEIVYKINYSSNPKRFLKDLNTYGINIDTSSTNWKIK